MTAALGVQRIGCPLEPASGGCTARVPNDLFSVQRLQRHVEVAHAALLDRLGRELSAYLGQWVADHQVSVPARKVKSRLRLVDNSAETVLDPAGSAVSS